MLRVFVVKQSADGAAFDLIAPPREPPEASALGAHLLEQFGSPGPARLKHRGQLSMTGEVCFEDHPAFGWPNDANRLEIEPVREVPIVSRWDGTPSGD
jgi:hypothetical protein